MKDEGTGDISGLPGHVSTGICTGALRVSLIRGKV